ncbi:MAG: biotin--[acetyl-CoA-carboxylase] ligase, partial [Gammaproteobacteria bacterium]
DAGRIRDAMPASSRRLLAGMEIHQETDSTNRLLLEQAAQRQAPYACLAEYQHAGQGRRGRPWVAPYGRNICLSLLWRFETTPAMLSVLGLVAGVAVLRALAALGVSAAGLKWPNDIVWRQAKLAGILVQLSGEMNGDCQVVIGIGLNLKMPAAAAVAIDQPWVDLETVLGLPPLRNQCCALLLHHLLETLTQFEAHGFAHLADEWRRHDVTHGQAVMVEQGEAYHEGIARGIDDSGALLLEQAGQLKRFMAGDVSLRRKQSF